LFKRTLKWSVILTVTLPIVAGLTWGVLQALAGGGSSTPADGSANGPPAVMPDLKSWPMIALLTAYDAWNLVMTLGVVAAFALLWQRPGCQRILFHFSPVGRMALTSYVMQSVFGALIFFHVGFGWLGELGNSVTLPLGMALFGLQMWISRFWLDRYHYGPLEWLWRSITWLRLQPLRK
jgi:uncharacterized protein